LEGKGGGRRRGDGRCRFGGKAGRRVTLAGRGFGPSKMQPWY
jgi:hypothetical protein